MYNYNRFYLSIFTIFVVILQNDISREHYVTVKTAENAGRYYPFHGHRYIISFLQQLVCCTFLHPTYVRHSLVVYSQSHL